MLKILLASATLVGLFGTAHAATVTPATDYTLGEGNECGAGGFSACTFDGSPSIIKFENNAGNLVVGDINTAFPSITGDEFSFEKTFVDGELIGIAFSFLMGLGDPGITAVIVKAGNNFASTSDFSVVGNLFTGFVSTEDAGLFNKKGKAQGVSHITFFDSYVPPSTIPLPAGGLLLVSALGGLVALRRRKSV